MLKIHRKVLLSSIVCLVLTFLLVMGQGFLGSEPTEARGPIVTGSFVATKTSPTRLEIFGIACDAVDGNGDGLADNSLDEFWNDWEEEYGDYATYFSQYVHDKCIDDDYTPSDPFGPSVVGVNIELIHTVSRLPEGWELCEGHEYTSFYEFVKLGLVSLPAESWDSFRSSGFAITQGGGGPISSTQRMEGLGGYSLPSNSSRPTFTPWAVICGPDATTLSGTGWKYLQGKTVTLPSLSRWPVVDD